MNNDYKTVEMKLNREIIDKLNKLISIEDFEENPEILEELGFEADSTVFSYVVNADDVKIGLTVCTGQANAWVEVFSIDVNNNISDCEPIFEEIEGEYWVDVCDGRQYMITVLAED